MDNSQYFFEALPILVKWHLSNKYGMTVTNCITFSAPTYILHIKEPCKGVTNEYLSNYKKGNPALTVKKTLTILKYTNYFFMRS